MTDNNQSNPEGDIIAETESYFVWRSDEDGEYVYHLELGGVSLHMTSEEWQELVELMKAVP
ncbi:MAG: hypothetical protein ACOCXI_05940 [Chloroflexota bacterium]